MITDTVRAAASPRYRRLLGWTGSGLLAGAATGAALYRESTTFWRPGSIQTGLDFSNNTWRAVRGLLSGADIYGPTHAVIPHIGPAWPVSQHVPASLLWQAPFAALPLPAALYAFTVASILAIWAAVFLLTRPKEPSDVFLAACCGAFAICVAGGPMTLLLGQPTGFILLGLAIVVHGKRPWLAGLGLLLAASTLQVAIPLAAALLVLGGWRVVWRGVVLIIACSVPPVILEIRNAGLSDSVRYYVTGAGMHLGRLSNRIDLGALLGRLGVHEVSLEVAAGASVAAAALILLARLPAGQRRLDNPPVLCLVIAFTLLCTYHQAYDMLLVGGAVIPVIFVVDRSRAMLPAFGIAGISAGFASYAIGLVLDPVGLVGIGLVSALAAVKAADRLGVTGGLDTSGPGQGPDHRQDGELIPQPVPATPAVRRAPPGRRQPGAAPANRTREGAEVR